MVENTRSTKRKRPRNSSVPGPLLSDSEAQPARTEELTPGSRRSRMSKSRRADVRTGTLSGSSDKGILPTDRHGINWELKFSTESSGYGASRCRPSVTSRGKMPAHEAAEVE
ncbi:hypothetical protein FRUB_08819 [Fimbriiglobus ruber]|uniref:Uncharacterized protein n=1 Tax=Fimbriiglobus ruber TaxID=1908690 RepID=A0A225DFX6_9BACT|nr:hypothetical protein FRUB_08819 [Fimbriiglobus ruber]